MCEIYDSHLIFQVTNHNVLLHNNGLVLFNFLSCNIFFVEFFLGRGGGMSVFTYCALERGLWSSFLGTDIPY